MLLSSGILYALALLSSFQWSLAKQKPATCKVLPGDPTWPSIHVWNVFNASVDGRLIRTVPIGSPCHQAMFDQEKCEFIRSNWHETSLHLSSSSSMMVPLWGNKSCDPFTAPTDQCVIGTYVQYAVNVSTVTHVAKTISFAKQHYIRFVVRNTGHDYIGKSTGTGALAIWTHFLQEITWIDKFASSAYEGPAIKAQAGVVVYQIYAAAQKNNHVVVAGACHDVGFTGEYIQGGGHSPLTSLFGLAADSALEFEVVTTNGKLVTVSPMQNSDLYWALSGGGGGTYEIVWSVIVKAHPDFPVTIASLAFDSTAISKDAYWEGISGYQSFSPGVTDEGGYAFAIYGAKSFSLAPLLVPNKTVAQVTALVNPLLNNLTALGINCTYSVYSKPSFQTGFDSIAGFVDLPVGTYSFGGRLLPRSLFTEAQSFSKMISVLREIVDGSGIAYDVSVRPSVQVSSNLSPNAVLPAWRDAQKLFITILPWNDTATDAEIIDTRNKITTTLDQPLRDLAPESGTYLNEADAQEPDWQDSFYGSNYPRLLAIKDKWDPDQLLYGATAVGGDRWKEEEDGRLCKVHAEG